MMRLQGLIADEAAAAVGVGVLVAYLGELRRRERQETEQERMAFGDECREQAREANYYNYPYYCDHSDDEFHHEGFWGTSLEYLEGLESRMRTG